MVLVKRLDNNTCVASAKQQTPFSKVRSPESPKHREERLREGERGGGRVTSKKGGSEARCFKMSPSTLLFFNNFR